MTSDLLHVDVATNVCVPPGVPRAAGDQQRRLCPSGLSDTTWDMEGKQAKDALTLNAEHVEHFSLLDITVTDFSEN